MFMRRKKSNVQDVSNSAATSPRPQVNLPSTPTATPLYERFATTTKAGSSARSSVVISRPMALGVKHGMGGTPGASASRISLGADLEPHASNMNVSISPPLKISAFNLKQHGREDLPPVPPVPEYAVSKSPLKDTSNKIVAPHHHKSPQTQLLSPPSSPDSKKRKESRDDVEQVAEVDESKALQSEFTPPPTPLSSTYTSGRPSSALTPTVEHTSVSISPIRSAPSALSSAVDSRLGSYSGAGTTVAMHTPGFPMVSSNAIHSLPLSTLSAFPVSSHSKDSSPTKTQLGDSDWSAVQSRPAPRRKYSPLAAFGLPVPETAPVSASTNVLVSASRSTQSKASDSDMRDEVTEKDKSKSTSALVPGIASRDAKTFAESGTIHSVRQESHVQTSNTLLANSHFDHNPEEEHSHSSLLAPSFSASVEASHYGISDNIDTHHGLSSTNLDPSSTEKRQLNGFSRTRSGTHTNTRHGKSPHNNPTDDTIVPVLTTPSSPTMTASQLSSSYQIPMNARAERDLLKVNKLSHERKRGELRSQSTPMAEKRRSQGSSRKQLEDVSESLYTPGVAERSTELVRTSDNKLLPLSDTLVPLSSIGDPVHSPKLESKSRSSSWTEDVSSLNKAGLTSDEPKATGRTTVSNVLDHDLPPPRVGSSAGERVYKSSSKKRDEVEGSSPKFIVIPTNSQNDDQGEHQALSDIASTNNHILAAQLNSDATASSLPLDADPVYRELPIRRSLEEGATYPPASLALMSPQTQAEGLRDMPSRHSRKGNSSQMSYSELSAIPVTSLPLVTSSPVSSSSKSPNSPSSQGSPVHATRKLTKSSHHTRKSQGVLASPPANPIDLATGAEMPHGVDPFAKDQIGHAQGVNTIPPQSIGRSSVDDYITARARRRGERLEKRSYEVNEVYDTISDRRRKDAESAQSEFEQELKPEQLREQEPSSDIEPEPEPEPEREPTFYPLERHLTSAALLTSLLPFLTFRDWCMLTEVNDAMRRAIEHKRELRETVLEHFLGIVGYVKWRWARKESILLTFRDLNSYMRGVSIPSHQYAVSAQRWLDSRQNGENNRLAAIQKTLLASSCRAYTRVVLRLRAQAEAEAEESFYQCTPPQSTTSVNVAHGRRTSSRSRSMSRPASPTSSAGYVNSRAPSTYSGHHPRRPTSVYSAPSVASSQFRSPLFRVGHAPLLRVFVPNAEGEWLSDQSVIDCEKELKRAGVLPLLRIGDVVWDTAVGDEGNVGRMIWDGNYLVDLDYTYSRTGEIPQSFHSLSFPPSYFHRIIRSPSNPICYMDLSPWGEEIATNLQLLQDRIRAEVPQGNHHTIVRWIHRSKFRVRPNPSTNAPVPIPNTSLSIDPGWYGTIIVETEGTNEGLADLQDRCKTGFPPRAGAIRNKAPSKIFRVLRERSRPGEIWIRAVREKERLL